MWGFVPTLDVTNSGCTYTRYVQLQKRNTSRNGGENMSAELDEKYENAWHSVAQPPRRRSGIIRELSLSMRVPTVSPANDG